MSDFAKRLRERRILLKLNQKDVARRSGLPPAAISHFETGRREPTMRNLKRLCRALNVSSDYLIGN